MPDSNEIENKIANLTDEQKRQLADLLEYPTVIFMLTDNFLKTTRQLMNILNVRNEFNQLCATKLACACETLGNTNAVIMSLIQGEQNKFIEGLNGASKENSTQTDSQN